MDPFSLVYEFHKAFGMAIDVKEPDYELTDLRFNLIDEEYNEVRDEMTNQEGFTLGSRINKKKLTKELADLLYVSIGTAISLGLPLQEVFEETHRSNMSKLDENGKPILRQDGKVLKGLNYKEPDLDKYF